MVGKPTPKMLVLSVALLSPLALCVTQASIAAPGTTASPLIDKDFEIAVRKHISKRFFNRIEATDEQRAKLDSIMSNTMETTRPDREALRHGVLELSSLVTSEDATDDQIKQKAHELRALHEKISDQRLDGMLQARKVLTKEQREQINRRIEQLITEGARPRRLGAMIDESL